VTTYDVGNVLAYTVTGLNPNTSYTITTRAYDSGGVRGADSSPLNVTTGAVPDAPTGLTAAANGVSGQVNVAWMAPANTGSSAIIDYQVNISGYFPITGVIDTAVTVAGLPDGISNTYTVQARNSTGLSVISGSASAAPNAASFHIRVNAGGPDYTDGSANVWAADNGFTGGTAASRPVGTTGTGDPGLFMWERTGMSQYQFTGLTNGTYHVDLLMAETYYTAVGQRIFSATANGQAIYTSLDVFAVAGAFKAITRSIDVVVNSGTLTLGFTSTVDLALVNAIHIFLPTTSVVVGSASLSAAASLSAIGHGVSTGTRALIATAVLQATAGGTVRQGSAALGAHATLSAVPITGGTVDVGNTLAYTITNLLPNTAYTITVRAYDGVGVRGADSSPLLVTTLTTTPTGSANLVVSSALSAFGVGVAKGTAPLQATATLVATASAPIKPGSAAIVAQATLFATAASVPIAGSAAIVASSTLFVAGLNVASASAPIQATASLSVTASAPIKLGSAALVAQGTLLATALGSGPIAGSANLTASASLFALGLEIAKASPTLTATSQLTATGAATSVANLTAASALATTATAFGVSQASTQLIGVATLVTTAGASVMIATAPLVATATLFANPTGVAVRVGSANLLAGSTLYALTVVTVRTGSAALHTTTSVLTATGTHFAYVPPLPAAVFAQPRLIVEIAVAVGPNLDASKTGTPNGLVLDDPNTSLGTSVLGSVTVWTEITSDVLHLDLSYGRSAGPLSDLTQPLVGSANITFENFSGNYDPGNPNGTFANGSGGTLLLPLRQVQIRAEWAGITYSLWRGYVEEYVPDYGVSPTVTMQCVGPLAVLAAAPIPKVDPPLWGGEKSGARINRILDAMGWPTSLRDIDVGNTVMPAAVFGDNALRLSQDVAIAEGGLLFTSAQTGSITLYDRNRILNAPRSLSVQAIFDDTGVNNTIDYLSMTVSYGAATIANSVTMNRVNGIAQTAEDSTSQLAYGKRELPNAPTNLQLTSDNQTQAVANWFLQQYKNPDLRVSEINAEGLPQNMWPAMLGLTLWDRVEVKRRYSAAYSFDKQLLVQGITHTIVPYQSWAVKLNTQAPATLSPFNFPPMVLDTSSGVDVGCLGY
jgi:hypothetical protein